MMFSNKSKNFSELPFIGRNNELKILQENLQSAFNYQGKCVVISGEPGIGKTRLVVEFLKNIQYAPITFNIVLQPRTSANLLFTEIINNYLNRAGRQIREIVQVIGREIYNNYSEVIPSLKVYFPYEPVSKKTDFSEMSHHFIEFIEKLSRFSFIIFILEEIQNAEEDVFILLNQLINRLDGLPILMILTSDNAKIIYKLQSKNLIKITLGNIGKDEILHLNEIIFANNLEGKFFDWLFTRTDGNPLFLKEYLLTLLEKGVIYYNELEERWCTIPNYEKIPVFKGIPDILKIRFAGLSKKQIEFLETASVVGERFNSSILKLKINLLNDLTRRGLIRKEQENYVFSHPIIREVIYDNIPENRKLTLHKKMGEFFAKKNDKYNALLHFDKAGIYKVWMVDYLLHNAKISENLRDFTRAGKFLGQGLNIAEKIKKFSIKKLLDIIAHYSHIKLKIGIYNDAIELAEKYLKLYKDAKIPVKRRFLEVYSILINGLVRAGKYNEAIRRSDEILAQIKKLKLDAYSDLVFDIMTNKAFALKYLGELDSALDIGLTLKNKIEKKTPLISQYYIYNLLGSIFNTRSEYNKAIEYRMLALQIAEKIGSPSLVASAQGNLGISYINNCDFEEGVKYLLQHRNYSIKSGMIREQIMACLNLGACYLFQGYFNQAVEEFQKGIKLCQETNNQSDLIWLLKYYSIALFFIGEYERALKLFKEGIELAKGMHNQNLQFTLMVYEGLILSVLNKVDEIKTLFEDIKKVFGKKYNEHPLYYLIAGIACLNNKKETRNALIKKSLILAEEQKDYSELVFMLYFCSKLLKNNPYRREHLRKLKFIVQKFKMLGWVGKLEPDTKKINPPILRIFTFGRMDIQKLNSEDLSIKLLNWQKLRDFFSILLISKIEGKRLTRDEIGIFLWPEFSKKQVTNNFHVYLSELKKIIGKDYFCYEDGVYFLDNVWIDAIEFSGLLNDAKVLYSQGKIHIAEEKLKDALKLYKGTFLEDCYGRWVEELREKINRQYRQALFLLSEIYLKKLKFEEVIENLQKVLILDPLDEEAHRFLMKTYLLNNEKSKAIEQYKKCADLFKREYNCQPSEETIKLYEEIKGK
ncbi:MAG: BTAD domain-containing putative transcriptional regulator [candidate division WOR-3 bacterium]